MPARRSLQPKANLEPSSQLEGKDLHPLAAENLPVAIQVAAYTAPRSLRAAAAFASGPRARHTLLLRLGLALGVSALTVALALAFAAWTGRADKTSSSPQALEGAEPASAAR